MFSYFCYKNDTFMQIMDYKKLPEKLLKQEKQDHLKQSY